MPRVPQPTKPTDKERETQENREPRSYYYDDAHGYQDFDPENEPEEDDEVEDEATS
jgi:hypothetical protein